MTFDVDLCAAGKYTIFAHVIDGMDVLEKMERTPTGDVLPNGVPIPKVVKLQATDMLHIAPS